MSPIYGRTPPCRYEDVLPTDLLDSSVHRGIGNVPEVPRHQKIDTIGDGDGDMRRIVRGSAWNRAKIDQRMREVLRIPCRIEKRHGFEPDAGGIGITRSGSGDDATRSNLSGTQPVFVRLHSSRSRAIM